VRARLLATLLIATACGASEGGPTVVDTPLEPLPDQAIPIPPAQQGLYQFWWHQVEQCAGTTRPFIHVKWFYVPGPGFFNYQSSSGLAGMWQPARNAIILAEFARNDEFVVRHEELHAILQRTDHPTEYFVDKCGPLVTP